jgi:hypothetical protein
LSFHSEVASFSLLVAQLTLSFFCLDGLDLADNGTNTAAISDAMSGPAVAVTTPAAIGSIFGGGTSKTPLSYGSTLLISAVLGPSRSSPSSNTAMTTIANSNSFTNEHGITFVTKARAAVIAQEPIVVLTGEDFMAVNPHHFGGFEPKKKPIQG